MPDNRDYSELAFDLIDLLDQIKGYQILLDCALSIAGNNYNTVMDDREKMDATCNLIGLYMDTIEQLHSRAKTLMSDEQLNEGS